MTKRHTYIAAILFLACTPGPILAAPPSAPQNICIEHAEGIDCADANTITSPNTSSGTIIAPRSVSPENFHPGHYLYVGESSTTPSSAFGILINSPEFAGGQRAYSWNSLEPSEGKYDFSKIEEDLDYLKSIGKHLWIKVQYTQFNGSAQPKTPSYMWNDSAYGCDPRYYGAYEREVSNGGWLPCFWNSKVKARFSALYSALGARFNNEPYFEGISIDETAVNPAAGEGHDGYSAATLMLSFQDKALAAKKAFPNKVVLQWINFAPYNIEEFASWLAKNGIGIGSPDLFLTNSSLIEVTYPQYLKYHNDVPTGPLISAASYKENNVQGLLNGAIVNTNPWYLFWRNTDPYFTAEVIPLVTNNSTAFLPAAKAFYDSKK